MNKRFLKLLKFSYVFLDFCTINLVFILCYFFFRQYNLVTKELEYAYVNFYLNASWLTAIVITNAYNEADITSFESFTKITIRTFIYFLLFVIVSFFFTKMITLSRVFIFTVLLSIFIILLLTRIIYLAIYQYYKRTDWSLNKVLIIGYNTLSKKLVTYLSGNINVRVVGYCEEYENVTELSSYPILGRINHALQLCKEYGINEIYSTIAPEQNRYLYDLIEVADQNCIRFKLVPDLGFFIKKQTHINYLKEIPVIALHKEPLQDVGNRIKKRLFDVIVSSLVIIFILSWLMPLVSLFIKLESKGKVLFLQERSGKNNKKFTCIKLRSMYKNTASHSQQASRGDERITRVGQVLRRTSLDEFPQFINVFMGEMSVVGPRPHMIKHTNEYSKQIDDYMVRQFLKPGITGWAQVNGYRGETKELGDMKKRIEHDLWYMENWSLLLDIKIMFLTVFNALKGEENAF